MPRITYVLSTTCRTSLQRARVAPDVLHACPMTVSLNQKATTRETKKPLFASLAAVLLFGMFSAASVAAQDAAQTPPSPSPPGDRTALPVTRDDLFIRNSVSGRSARSTRRPASCWCDRRAHAPCLWEDTWGYDLTSIWVSDGCSAVFATGAVAQVQVTTHPRRPVVRSERRVPALRR